MPTASAREKAISASAAVEEPGGAAALEGSKVDVAADRLERPLRWADASVAAVKAGRRCVEHPSDRVDARGLRVLETPCVLPRGATSFAGLGFAVEGLPPEVAVVFPAGKTWGSVAMEWHFVDGTDQVVAAVQVAEDLPSNPAPVPDANARVGGLPAERRRTDLKSYGIRGRGNEAVTLLRLEQPFAYAFWIAWLDGHGWIERGITFNRETLDPFAIVCERGKGPMTRPDCEPKECERLKCAAVPSPYGPQ